MEVIEPATPEEFQKYYRLRYETLRQPWGQPEGSERVEDDATAIHAMLVDDDGEAVGICRLHMNTPQEGQLRFMGIRKDKQGQQLGNQLMEYLEARAKALGAMTLTLQARENAVNFYRRNGYEVVEETYILFGTIQHYRMTKQL
ncbi:GNAT family N-acetyltransferase [Pontibacter diazotrophicus]|uniref:GNAT family N-acetyltransferase n=1 Tax=Pontibacter diazotrophicus TaxID=1400979 RepID=A0A3D8LDT6_9BACT|nr:GNAT family N-acetyltransferase [Pontibacter diazotrophicus]RDV15557.1 GNAT family N-acetyltransferase [Pontibacter diazotrophicus]